jgi:cell division septation protein DedD
MLVGRGQGQRAAKAEAQSQAAKLDAGAARSSPEETKSGTASFQGVETGKLKAAPVAADPPPVREPAPVTPEPAIEVREEKTAPKAPASEKMIYVQVDALEKEAAARKEQEELRKKGFAALVTSSDGSNKLFRVQVGPFATVSDAEVARKKLEALGYKPMIKK